MTEAQLEDLIRRVLREELARVMPARVRRAEAKAMAAQLAALRDATNDLCARGILTTVGVRDGDEAERMVAWQEALSCTAAAAEAYRAQVRREALEEAAVECEREAAQCATATGDYISRRCAALIRAMAEVKP